MRPRLRMRQHLRQEDPLIDLDPVLVAQRAVALRRDPGARRGQSRHQRRRVVDQALEADAIGVVARQGAVDRVDMDGKKTVARLPLDPQDRLRRGRFEGVAVRLHREEGDEIGALPPEPGECRRSRW